MKLNKYLYKKMTERRHEELHPLTEEDIEDWIIDWYKDTFQEIGLGKEGTAKARSPPMWLAGPRWYDRRKKILEAAETKRIEEAEAKSYEKDE